MFVAFCNFGEGTFYDELTVLGEGWLSKLGVSASFGVGGFSVLLVALTSKIGDITTIAANIGANINNFKDNKLNIIPHRFRLP